ncbi:hypothetical protein [Vibrio cyclitrophicus]|uniref:hypothetical protein n=1 Tax=Vibrio cyclitrophicus TaxID=47951 RepID=UPI000317E2CB|nr:hypothetical protein [Vibrio cyclitrophicus]ERM59217.1 hypothetical protein M565_ctg4P512 [Vibrio cyclitrophicus FF75]OEE47433.1 hypothetical protein OAG_12520 [Vibrio cyclitrophicus FF75]
MGVSILICDEKKFKPDSYEGFDKIYVVSNKEYRNSNVTSIRPNRLFIKSHKRGREFNRHLIETSPIGNKLTLSLIKSIDIRVFQCMRLIECMMDVDVEKGSRVSFLSYDSELLTYILKYFNLNYETILSLPSKRKATLGLRFYLKALVLYINSLFIRGDSNNKVFISYDDSVAYRILEPYEKECTIYPLLSNNLIFSKGLNFSKGHFDRKFLSFSGFKYFLCASLMTRKDIKNSKLPSAIKETYLGKVTELEIEVAQILSVKGKLKKLTHVYGFFDTCSYIDYTTEVLNKLQKVRTVCIPHGVNYKEKCHYISYGTNIYSLWSENHFERMESSNLLEDEVTTKLITGHIGYYKNALLPKSVANQKNILVVGEYFSKDGYYSSPFNESTSRRLFSVLKQFADLTNTSVTIRTRLNDDYMKVAQDYACEKIVISTANVDLVEQILSHDLVISVFSNVLHEALILKREVLQVNFLDISNYRDLAGDKLVHYATNEQECYKLLSLWHECNLPEIDFDYHLKKYCNDGNFNKVTC